MKAITTATATTRKILADHPFLYPWWRSGSQNPTGNRMERLSIYKIRYTQWSSGNGRWLRLKNESIYWKPRNLSWKIRGFLFYWSESSIRWKIDISGDISGVVWVQLGWNVWKLWTKLPLSSGNYGNNGPLCKGKISSRPIRSQTPVLSGDEGPVLSTLSGIRLRVITKRRVKTKRYRKALSIELRVRD